MIERILLLLVLLIPLSTFADTGEVKGKAYSITGTAQEEMRHFDKAMIDMMKTWDMPGAAVAIMQNDKLTFSRGYGWADIDTKKPVQPDSHFRIASISKMITATAILRLIEEKRLSLDDKIFDILSDIKPVAGRKFNAKQKNITVKDLLYMSSGWVANGKHGFDPMFGPWPADIVKIIGYHNLPASCADMTSVMMTMPLRSVPGSRYAYSNLDYCVLGLVVSKITANGYDHKGYEHYIQNKLLKPLNIQTMHIGTTTLSNIHPNEVTYYRYSGHVDISHQRRSTYFPYGDDEMLHKNFANGGWVATAPDLVRFIHELSAGKILSKPSLELMTTPPSYANKKTKHFFGMGWKFKNVDKQQIWYQTGSFTGTSAFVIRKPNGMAIAVIFNARPPIYHMWKDFRPKLYRLFNASLEDAVSKAVALVNESTLEA